MAEPAEFPRTITDFADAHSNDTWQVINDDVMGGRSSGGRTFESDTMIFSGAINTDGGGFASLRFPIDDGALEGISSVVFHALSDGREYLVTFDDKVEGRDRRISFRASIEFATPGEWETASVDLDNLYAAAFGKRVDTDPFRPDLANRIGIMLKDGVDGNFRLEIDRIEVI